MFGLLNPGRQDPLYRRAYARCCQHQRRRYGLPSLPFLSYESILLYLCAADAGKVSLEDLPAVACCKLRRLPVQTPAAERETARFCSSVGMLLAYIKLSDDLRDGPSLLSRLANLALRSRFREAFDYFGRLDPAFEQRVSAFIEEHLELERRQEPAPLHDYIRPTARAFGYVFSLLGRLTGMEAHAGFLAALGEHVGSAIIAFDCAVDRDKDRRRGQYNPLPEGDEPVRAALAECRRHLFLAAEEARRQFGEESHTARVVTLAAQRIPHGSRQTACQRFRNETKSIWQRWGIGRRKGVQLNSGLDVVIGILGFIGVCIGGLVCLSTSAKKARELEQARRAAEAANAMAADQPSQEPNVPLTPEETAAVAAVGATAPAGTKKMNSCGGCECWGCDPGCGDLACCTADAAANGADCGGCDACSGCDCNCG